MLSRPVQIRRFLGALLVVFVGVVTLSAQTRRTFTNPRPEPYFKALFPNAGGFSTFGGTPLHYKVYGVDPKANPNAPPIGFIFWTTDLVPTDVGYHGPIHFLVGMDTRGIIQSVVMDYNSEPYGYFSVDSAEVRRAVQEQERARSVPGRSRHCGGVARLDHRQSRRARAA